MATLPLCSTRILSLPSQLRYQTLKHAFAPALVCATPSAPPGVSRPVRPYATSNARVNATQSSVNHDEVAHFNVLASSWWDPHGSSRLLHLMNPLRHDFMRQCLAISGDLTPGRAAKRRILDIGCGGGIFAESAARLATTESVTAIDPTPEVIAVAKKHQRADPMLLEPGRLTYRNMAIEELPADEMFDIISLFEVVEHIQSPSPFLRTCLEHLKPGGWLIGSTIARTNVSWFTTKFVAEEVLQMVPRGTHDWNQYIQPHELREWARGQQELDADIGGPGWQTMGVVYVPGLGWKVVPGSQDWGNYFFGMRKKMDVAVD